MSKYQILPSFFHLFSTSLSPSLILEVLVKSVLLVAAIAVTCFVTVSVINFVVAMVTAFVLFLLSVAVQLFFTAMFCIVMIVCLYLLKNS